MIKEEYPTTSKPSNFRPLSRMATQETINSVDDERSEEEETSTEKKVNDMEWFVAPKLEFEPLSFSAPMPKAA